MYRPRTAVGWYWERRTGYEALWSLSHCESRSFQRDSEMTERDRKDYNTAEMGYDRDLCVCASYLKNFSMRRWRLWIQPSLAGWIDWALYEMRVSTDASCHTNTHKNNITKKAAVCKIIKRKHRILKELTGLLSAHFSTRLKNFSVEPWYPFCSYSSSTVVKSS